MMGLKIKRIFNYISSVSLLGLLLSLGLKGGRPKKCALLNSTSLNQLNTTRKMQHCDKTKE
eukprot:UN25964